jgi:hypothetical protein
MSRYLYSTRYGDDFVVFIKKFFREELRHGSRPAIATIGFIELAISIDGDVA